MMTIIVFLAGVLLGVWLGALVMAVMAISGRESRREEARGFKDG